MKINLVNNFNIKNGAQNKKASHFCMRPEIQNNPIVFSAKLDINKPIEQMSFKEKIDFFKKHHLVKDEILYISKRDELYINRVIYLMRNGADFYQAADIADLDLEDYEKAYDLIENEQSDPYGIMNIIFFPKRDYDKTHIVISKGVYSAAAASIGNMSDKQYMRVLELLKLGVGDNKAQKIAMYSDSNYQKAYLMLKKGANANRIVLLFDGRFASEINSILDLLDKNVLFSDALNIETRADDTKEKFYKFQQNYDNQIAGILANMRFPNNCCDDKSIEKIANMVKAITANSKKYSDFSAQFSEFLLQRIKEKQDLDKIEKYILSINFDQLKQLAPHMINYTSEQMLEFIEWHMDKKTLEFNKEVLEIQGGLTKYLENNHIDAQKLNSLLIAHPLTKREVGEIPSSWLVEVDDKEKASKEIYKAIKKFQKERKKEQFESDLSKILNKKVQIQKIAKGQYGTGYKLSIDGAEPVCLKLFHSNYNDYFSLSHGQNNEVQAGLFLNCHSNDFVKMFFGKVSTKYTRDGFLVTQFLSKDIKPLKYDILRDYSIVYRDQKADNEINNTYIDYGGVMIRPI